MTGIPATMRAWTHPKAGKPQTVLSLADLPVPALASPSSVLVAVSHAALNPGGSILMQLCPSVFRKKPCIPELDFSGTVVKVGEAVPASRNLAEGTPVFGSIPVLAHIGKGVGALAEFVSVEHDFVVGKPANISFEEAAGLGVAGATGLCLMEGAKLQPGDKVLVNGASGGCGHFAIQMAKNAVGETGKVVAICSAKNADFVKSLGADEVIDYNAHSPVTDYLSTRYAQDPFDVVIDAVGRQEIFTNSPKYLLAGKPFVSVGVSPPTYAYGAFFSVIAQMMSNNMRPKLLGGVDRPHVQVAAQSDLKTLDKLRTLVEEGKLKAVAGSTFEMQDVLKAYDQMLSKHAKGKIVVKIEN